MKQCVNDSDAEIRLSKIPELGDRSHHFQAVYGQTSCEFVMISNGRWARPKIFEYVLELENLEDEVPQFRDFEVCDNFANLSHCALHRADRFRQERKQIKAGVGFPFQQCQLILIPIACFNHGCQPKMHARRILDQPGFRPVDCHSNEIRIHQLDTCRFL